MLIARVPLPPLSQFADMLWYAADWKPPHSRERHMPDGSVSVIVLLHDERASASDAAIVTGARSEASWLDTSEPQTVMGVHFKPGGAGPFFDVPVSELTNLDAALADVAEAQFLHEQLLDAATPDARLDRLHDWLIERLLRHRPRLEPAIAWAVRQFERQPHVRISAVADHIGRSSRWFVERFAGDVGLTPKVFSRVQRFQFALRQLHAGAHADLADLAAAAGYFDQAHFTHDFRSIAGLTPTAYLAARTDHPNHVAMADQRPNGSEK